MISVDSGAFTALTPEPAQKVQRSRPRVQAPAPAPERKTWRDRLPTLNSNTGQPYLFIAGLAAITFGFYLIYRPLGPIVGGVFAIYLAFLWESETGDEQENPRPIPGR